MKVIGIALAFNGLDLVTGFISAVKEKDIMSSKLRNGLFKKAGFIFCYVLAWLLDTHGQVLGFAFPVKLLPVVIGYVVLIECVSIIENICRLNPDLLPEKLIELFHIGGLIRDEHEID